ncbi:MAG: NAD-dependent epimerase/dehydratase family protein [Verrucomicrobiales bacterium]|jgi:nucleoside-diphosphate-sugar epimerase
MKAILVTGAAGFIGAAVTQTLLDQGCRVYGIDNLNDYYDIRLKLHRLDQLRQHENFQFDAVDIESADATKRYLERNDVEVVYHLAARAGVRYSIDYPYVYQTSNVIGTLNILEAMRYHGPSKAVLSSSSSLYAGQEGPFTEDMIVDQPLSPYAASKKSMEVLAYSYHHLHNLDLSILRYFTVYGPAGRPDMSPFRFTKWIAEGQPIQIYGDGHQSRDFTFVGDVVAGTIAAARPLGYEIINIGGGNRPTTLLDMIKILEEQLGRAAVTEFFPVSSGDMRHTSSDISKARTLLDWEPKVGIEQGLQETVQWYQENADWLCDLSV